MIDLLTAQRRIDPEKLDAGTLGVALRQFYCRKYVTRAAGLGAARLDAETRDLIDTTARFVGRMDDDFRASLEAKLRKAFLVTADERQKAMGLSYVCAELDALVTIVTELAKPSAPVDPVAEAKAAARAGVEQLLCGTRVIRKISDALGFDDPEGVAARVNTDTLQIVIADLLVAEVKRASGR
jgi:hypothetical protein